MEYHFVKWHGQPEFSFTLVYKITKQFMDGVENVLQPLIHEVRLVGFSANTSWVTGMVKMLVGHLEQQIFMALEIVRAALVLLHHIIDGDRDYAEFMLLPRKRFTDFATVRKKIIAANDRKIGCSKQISVVPTHLSIFSPQDLTGHTKVAIEGQPDNIVQDIENMVGSSELLKDDPFSSPLRTPRDLSLSCC